MHYIGYFIISTIIAVTYRHVNFNGLYEQYYRLKIRNIPTHIGIIADGNGRWAKSKGQSRTYGHNVGAQRFDHIIKASIDIGVRVLTFYVFSTENWKRPQSEIDYLFDMLNYKLSTICNLDDNDNMFNKISVYFVGSRKRLPIDILTKISTIEQANFSKVSTVITLVFAIDYGGHEEIVTAVQSLLVDNPLIKPEEVTKSKLDAHMCLPNHIWPDPDLIIRSSGECRLSGFMTWHIGYSELYFCSTFWPDFSTIDLLKAISWYSSRMRRFGGLTS